MKDVSISYLKIGDLSLPCYKVGPLLNVELESLSMALCNWGYNPICRDYTSIYNPQGPWDWYIYLHLP